MDIAGPGFLLGMEIINTIRYLYFQQVKNLAKTQKKGLPCSAAFCFIQFLIRFNREEPLKTEGFVLFETEHKLPFPL
jgi:hypothetical protein